MESIETGPHNTGSRADGNRKQRGSRSLTAKSVGRLDIIKRCPSSRVCKVSISPLSTRTRKWMVGHLQSLTSSATLTSRLLRFIRWFWRFLVSDSSRGRQAKRGPYGSMFGQKRFRALS